MPYCNTPYFWTQENIVELLQSGCCGEETFVVLLNIDKTYIFTVATSKKLMYVTIG